MSAGPAGAAVSHFLIVAMRENVERWRGDLGVCAKEYVRDVTLLLDQHDAIVAVLEKVNEMLREVELRTRP